MAVDSCASSELSSSTFLFQHKHQYQPVICGCRTKKVTVQRIVTYYLSSAVRLVEPANSAELARSAWVTVVSAVAFEPALGSLIGIGVMVGCQESQSWFWC